MKYGSKHGLTLLAMVGASVFLSGCEPPGAKSPGDPVVGHYRLVEYRVESGGSQPASWSGDGEVINDHQFGGHIHSDGATHGFVFDFKENANEYSFDGGIFSYTTVVNWQNAPALTYHAEWQLVDDGETNINP